VIAAIMVAAILAFWLWVSLLVGRKLFCGSEEVACPRCGGDVQFLGDINGLAWDGKLYSCLCCGQRFRMEERHVEE
jgi:DNA-directed RNA polymerase subunit RPC12/RpoP